MGRGSDDHSDNLLFDHVEEDYDPTSADRDDYETYSEWADAYVQEHVDMSSAFLEMEETSNQESERRREELIRYKNMQFHFGLSFFNLNKLKEAVNWWIKAAQQETNPNEYGYDPFEDRHEDYRKDYVLSENGWDSIESLKTMSTSYSYFMIGSYYYLGLSVERNYGETAKYFKKIEEEQSDDYDGYLQAQILLCNMYNKGEISIDNGCVACKSYFISKKIGATIDIDNEFLEGLTIDDINNAHESVSLSSDEIKTKSMIEEERNWLLGQLATGGLNPAKYELEKAVNLYKKAIENTDFYSLHQYATIYKNKLLTPKDYEIEFEWLLEKIAGFYDLFLSDMEKKAKKNLYIDFYNANSFGDMEEDDDMSLYSPP